MDDTAESEYIYRKEMSAKVKYRWTDCILFQVVIVGNGGVGKSSVIQRYCKGVFTKDYKKTIGVDFLERQIE